jgi:hypothetical protein
VVATKTFMAGLELPTDVAIIQNECERNLKQTMKIAQGRLDGADTQLGSVNAPR